MCVREMLDGQKEEQTVIRGNKIDLYPVQASDLGTHIQTHKTNTSRGQTVLAELPLSQAQLFFTQTQIADDLGLFKAKGKERRQET